MDIPHALVETVREGRVFLFLGAGASKGALAPDGSEPPNGTQLGKMLAEKFLGGEDADEPLNVIAEYAVSETDLVTVQEFLRDIFSQFEPADFHRLIPTFKWAGLATTNYDLLIERAYDTANPVVQELVLFLRDQDRVESRLRSDNAVPYLKLHGCISKCDDPGLPLILTIDQYVTHRKSRQRLFQRLADYGAEYPIVFVGQQLQDPDLRQILMEISQHSNSRPRFYAVTPEPTARQVRFWESKKITALPGTLKSFLEQLDSSLDPALRAIRLTAREHPIERKFVSNESQLSQEALALLKYDLSYIFEDMPIEHVDPKKFYSGYSHGWNAIQNNFDSRRDLEDTVLSDAVLLDEIDRSAISDLYLIKGHAGSGKTVIMKRIAWDAMAEFGKLCLYCDSSQSIDRSAVLEIVEKVGERVFLFIDTASEHLFDIRALVEISRRQNHKLTIIAASRTNEWNIDSGTLDSLLEDVFEIRFLKAREIELLLEKLSQNKSLGLLEGLTNEQQVEAFTSKAGRQLLVALHEATLGKPFEEIVYDEYKNIEPHEAQSIYVTVCALNRLDVPVRAGVINRIHGVSFEKFRREFFRPLEAVVYPRTYLGNDMAYFSRHPWIAEIVFERALVDVNERLDLYLRLVESLDVGYESDRKAFRQLIRARNLSQLFPDPLMVRAIFDRGAEAGEVDAYYYQQRAIWEMRRDNPNLDRAYEFLREANKISPNDRSIAHSLSELELARAEKARTSVEVNRHLSAASEIAARLTGANAEDSYGYHTICKIALQRLRTKLLDSPDDELSITDAIKGAEDAMQKALQRFPDDEYLLTAESELAATVGANGRALVALEKAFRINSMSPYTARGLARLYEERGNFADARAVLEKCLEGLPGDKSINGALASLLDRRYPVETDLAEYHWRRAFTEGDSNYMNQFWYARRLWLNGKKQDAKPYFEKLRIARVSPDVKQKIRGMIVGSNGKHEIYRGRLERLEDTYAFLSLELGEDWVFLHRSQVEPAVWEELERLVPVKFEMGFTYRGLAARNVEMVREG